MASPIQKMRADGLSEAAVAAFERALEVVRSGETPHIAEAQILPAEGVEDYGALADPDGGEFGGLLGETVVIKLNGGLGTGMGLERAKSLLEVREGLTFLDLIARQVLAAREGAGAAVRFLLMNSFSTSEDTLSFLEKYPELGRGADLELLQNRVPKIDPPTFEAVEWPADPALEWCPPGHGDLYPALVGSGWLERLLAAGVRYAFVSNSDNLGATLDGRLLAEFARSGAPFLMEVTARTEADRKGGHLARWADGGGLLLRESAQCPEADTAEFQNIEKHRFFNTNNLWLRLDALRDEMAAHGGVLPLPVIANRKTVDPRDPASPAVIQLETAMGAALGCFEGARAVAVPRSRFAPVKTTDDLLALRSDAYVLTADARLELAPGRDGCPPVVSLDKAHFKRADQLDSALAQGVPSLIDCGRLTVTGPVRFGAGVSFAGDVEVINASPEAATLPGGRYAQGRVEL